MLIIIIIYYFKIIFFLIEWIYFQDYMTNRIKYMRGSLFDIISKFQNNYDVLIKLLVYLIKCYYYSRV